MTVPEHGACAGEIKKQPNKSGVIHHIKNSEYRFSLLQSSHSEGDFCGNLTWFLKSSRGNLKS